MRSRVIPPKFPAASDKTRTPNKSSLRLTPALAPLSANTKVPRRRSSTNRSVFIAVAGPKRDETALYAARIDQTPEVWLTPLPDSPAPPQPMFPRPSAGWDERAPTNRTREACHSVPNDPKSSLAGAGPVCRTRSAGADRPSQRLPAPCRGESDDKPRPPGGPSRVASCQLRRSAVQAHSDGPDL